MTFSWCPKSLNCLEHQHCQVVLKDVRLREFDHRGVDRRRHRIESVELYDPLLAPGSGGRPD
jgi:hypothetical protein